MGLLHHFGLDSTVICPFFKETLKVILTLKWTDNCTIESKVLQEA